MKKILVLAVIAVSLNSCKKDRVCECTYQDGTTYSKTTYTHVTKKEAKSLCTSSTAGISCTVN